jgi:hypothetical protein
VEKKKKITTFPDKKMRKKKDIGQIGKFEIIGGKNYEK